MNMCISIIITAISLSSPPSSSRYHYHVIIISPLLLRSIDAVKGSCFSPVVSIHIGVALQCIRIQSTVMYIRIHSTFIVLILLLILELLAQLVKRSKSQSDQSKYELIESFSEIPEKLYGSAGSAKNGKVSPISSKLKFSSSYLAPESQNPAASQQQQQKFRICRY
jgi:hypothetical protein